MPLCLAIPLNYEDTSSWKRPPKGMTSLLTPLFRDPERSSGRLLRKNKYSSKRKVFSSLLGTHLQRSQTRTTIFCASQGEWQGSPRNPLKPRYHPGLQTDSDKTHKTVIISHHAPVFWEYLALEERVIHRQSPDKNTSFSRPREKEASKRRHQRFSRLKPARHDWTTVKSHYQSRATQDKYHFRSKQDSHQLS